MGVSLTQNEAQMKLYLSSLPYRITGDAIVYFPGPLRTVAPHYNPVIFRPVDGKNETLLGGPEFLDSINVSLLLVRPSPGDLPRESHGQNTPLHRVDSISTSPCRITLSLFSTYQRFFACEV